MKKLIIFCSAIFFPALIFAQQKPASYNLQLAIGTYTTGKSEGIYLYDFNSSTGKFAPVSSIFTPDPSYLAIAADNRFLYAVNETGAGKGPGMISSFSYNGGKLAKINTVPTGGDDPCYTTIDKTGKWLAAGNYSGGNFSVFPLNADGSIGNAVSTTDHHGTSANRERQEKAHVHCTVFSPDNKYLLVADLGTDQITGYRFNAKKGTIGKAAYTNVPPGAGPRHLTFHPNGKYVYLVEELFGNVEFFRYKKGKLSRQQTISMVPPKFLGKIAAADIHFSPDGRFLYTSNRGGADLITIFSVDDKGRLKVVGYQSVMGIGPRNFTIDPSGNFLLVANQSTDEVVIFKRDKYSGLLTDTNERIKVPSPVCLKWMN